MKIISWNVNGIRAVEKKGFTDWLLNCGADVVCIQETKAHPSQLTQNILAPGSEENILFPIPAKESASPVKIEDENALYKSYWSSAKKAGYSSTAIYSKKQPDKVELLGNSEFDDEGRVLSAYFGKTVIISAYFPNSQNQGSRLDYKLGFCNAIFEYLKKLVSDGFNIVLCGDYNIAHKAIDLANPKANEGNAGYLPEEREWMEFFTTNGFTDTFRKFCQEPKQYTWWSYRFHAREKDIGWRIDYQCVNNDFINKVKSSKILKDVMGSDHCPIEIEIQE
ncbi:MAG: exodeoxyribonuclease III [Treponema sp.]|jgi:exodeoxyribonuclease-3|uniref:exodeoxyribonuclease III n=1 Tax=Treponema sp. TaxID=166 RepID=UPI002A914E12|nr:exodeoxyribonuclease III [Treponema sp.]MDY6397987.1 exodeoxyribonuclease III [Treponema sp.]